MGLTLQIWAILKPLAKHRGRAYPPTVESEHEMSTPSFKPTDEQRRQVEILAEIGLPHEMISRVIGCSKPTLRKYFREELDLGDAKATVKVAETLFNKAINGNVACMIFWMKARAGWSEKNTMQRNNQCSSQLTPSNLHYISETEEDDSEEDVQKQELEAA